MKHPVTRHIARYIAATYPMGLKVWTLAMGKWRPIYMSKGLQQGRVLSLVAASILMKPIIVAAFDAMWKAQFPEDY